MRPQPPGFAFPLVQTDRYSGPHAACQAEHVYTVGLSRCDAAGHDRGGVLPHHWEPAEDLLFFATETC